MQKAKPYFQSDLFDYRPQRTFSGLNALQISMPLGGIGAGCICISGEGGLQDFSIRNRPDTTALPDEYQGKVNTDAAFALLHLPNQGITRLVEGPMPPEKIYNQGIKNQGYRAGGHEGLPRFRECSFKGEFPFAEVNLSDSSIPLDVQITAFNPFIPLDDVNSGLPCAILEYSLSNPGVEAVPFEFSFHLSHLAPGKDELSQHTTRNTLIPGSGVFMHNVENPYAAEFGNCALGVIGHTPLIKGMWLRGGWFDSISALWREVSEGTFEPNAGTTAKDEEETRGFYRDDRKRRNGGSILMKGILQPGEQITYPVVIAWYFPNVHYAFGGEAHQQSHACCSPFQLGNVPRWRPFYTSQWGDARQVFQYVCEHYNSLRSRTQQFHDALFQSSLPWYVLDAVSANLAILKSPTVLRQENGNLWAWEGCYCDKGCCSGSCTHVWNYAQAVAHLFPQLERTLREQELERSMDEHGHINFRSALPDGPATHTFHAASDGQLGGIMKVYREWRISADRVWLEKMYPLAKRSLDYCIEVWDPQHKGVLEEPHHNTYDIEFWGPNGMCSSFYLGALAAMAALAHAVGRPQDAPFYAQLAQKGAAYLDEELFNGEYYEQKVAYKNLRDTSFAKLIAGFKQPYSAEERLLVQEGPKYQYGSGCISDGVFGAWLAGLCGLESPQKRENLRRSLQSIFAYNFKPSLWEYANPQRPGYAWGDEPGLLLCTWPRGGKPTLPFVYSDEVWTGVEYQAATHMIYEGLLEEGLTIVRALRSRYNGRVRNPWNEYECGSYYARALASYALLGVLSGFDYSAVEKKLSLAPRLEQSPFQVFFSTASGWGTLHLTDAALEIEVSEGTLAVEQLELQWQGKPYSLQPALIAHAGEKVKIELPA